MQRRFILLVVLFGCFTFMGYARFEETKKIKALLQNNIKEQLEHRYDKRQVFDTKQFLDDNSSFSYHDGLTPFPSLLDKSQDGLKLSIEKLGNDTVFVYRNAIDDPVEVYYLVKYNLTREPIRVHYLLAGNYMLANGKNSVFGLWQDFYKGSEYNTDPGIYQIVKMGNNIIEIIYGPNRVSNGAPGSGDMPGAGGAGAICPFLKWDLKLTADGLEARKTFGDKYVDQYPRLEAGNNVLTKVQCPWEGLDGKWAFTAVMPLTHSLLKLFPKDALELMYAEIFARHGNVFEDSELQQYFDAQPWYKKSTGPIELTDIEQFNADLINEVIMSKY